MNTSKIAKGWALIAEGAMELSLAYESIEPAARAAVSDSVPTAPAGSAAGVTPTPAAPLQAQHVETVLGQCPDHQVAWTVKPGGIGAKGEYPAFWRCNQRVGDGWCKKRPVKAWADSHPIQAAA